MMYRYTDTELKKILSTSTVLIDTREQVNDHITSYFDKQKVSYESKKLHTGDYSIKVQADESNGIMKDTYFPIVIERKNSIDELAQSIKVERFESELIRANNLIFILLVEDTYENLITGNYRSQYEPKALLARLMAFEARYGFTTVFMDKRYVGNFIYHKLKYQVREYLKCKVA